MSLNYKKISEFFGVGVGIEAEKKNIFGIGVEIGIGEKIFSESESGFGSKNCDSADDSFIPRSNNTVPYTDRTIIKIGPYKAVYCENTDLYYCAPRWHCIRGRISAPDILSVYGSYSSTWVAFKIKVHTVINRLYLFKQNTIKF
jgi:hypothetical protein